MPASLAKRRANNSLLVRHQFDIVYQRQIQHARHKTRAYALYLVRCGLKLVMSAWLAGILLDEFIQHLQPQLQKKLYLAAGRAQAPPSRHLFRVSLFWCAPALLEHFLQPEQTDDGFAVGDLALSYPVQRLIQ